MIGSKNKKKEEKKNIPIMPLAERISGWGNSTEVIYKCAICGTSFAILGPRTHYCHTCGTPQDWNVVQYLKTPFHGETMKDREEIVKQIDLFNHQSQTVEEVRVYNKEVGRYNNTPGQGYMPYKSVGPVPPPPWDKEITPGRSPG